MCYPNLDETVLTRFSVVDGNDLNRLLIACGVAANACKPDFPVAHHDALPIGNRLIALPGNSFPDLFGKRLFAISFEMSGVLIVTDLPLMRALKG